MIECMGTMIRKLREQMGVSQECLGRGLVSVAEMSKIESGGREADCFLLEALFQRLGKSIDKFEMTISDAEYQMIFLRNLILRQFGEKDYEAVQELLEEYQRQSRSDFPLHRQFRWEMEALLTYSKRKDKEGCIELLQQAMEITFPQWRKENLAHSCLCIQEGQILLLFLATMWELGDVEIAERKLGELFSCLKERYSDTEARAKLYPQVSWILGKICCEQGNFGIASKFCEQGMACLAENGILSGLEQLLELQIVCAEKVGKQEEVCELRKLQEAIAFLYQLTGVKDPEGDILSLLLNSRNQDMLIDRELLREMRLALGLSQEKLSEGICSWETLSRIERGERKPNRKKLYQMYQRLKVDRQKYYGYIQTDDFALYEMVREAKMKWLHEEKDLSITLTKAIGEKLDMEIPLNRQFIEYNQLLATAGKGIITWEEAIKEAERILCYTMKDYQGIVYRIPSREECVLLNFIALCYKRCGKLDEAIGIWEQMLDKYRGGKVSEEYHIASEMLIYMNYPGILEVNNCLDKAQQEGMAGIRLMLKCQRGDACAIMLGNLACVFEKRNTPESAILCEESLRHSFFLLKFYGYWKDCEIVKIYYEKSCGRSLK